MASELSTALTDLDRRFGVTGKKPAVCEKHGDYISVLRDGHEPSSCPTCFAEVRAEEDRLNKLRDFAHWQLQKARIPRRFAEKSFANYEARTPEQKEALEICQAYADNFEEHLKAGRCMLLLGSLGTGKTHLAIAIANRLIHKKGISAIYRTVGGVLAEIRSSYDARDVTEEEVMRSLIAPKLLILDEAGATKPSEFELATLFRIINGRYEQLLPTIVISNLPADELSAALGERCVDRLREGGGFAIGFDWKSARGRAKS
jgi:DNA replication protein DnaC